MKDAINRYQVMITSLDEMIEKDSTVRIIDKFVRSLDVEKLGYHVYTNKIGRPAYDVHELIALYLYSYMNQVMSSRMLEKQTFINIEIMWLLSGKHPDHSTIAAFRSKNSEALVNTFREFTIRCIQEKIIDGKTVAVDGTKFHASNNKKNNYSVKTLKKKIQAIDEKIETYFSEFDTEDEKIEELSKRKENYENMLSKLENSEETQISTTDPDARLMDNKKGGLDVGYNVQAIVDTKSHMIIEQYVTNHPTDQRELATATEKAQEILKNKELNVLADKGYYNAEDIKKSFELGVTPIVARQNPPKREGRYSINEFKYEAEKDVFVCPNGECLSRISSDNANGLVYGNKSACEKCPYKEKCFNQSGKYKYKRINKNKDFVYMEKADKIFAENKELYHKRQETIEHVFGTMKRVLGFAELHVRTNEKVAGEISLLCLAYNFKRMIKILGKEALKALIYCYFRAFFEKNKNSSEIFLFRRKILM